MSKVSIHHDASSLDLRMREEGGRRVVTIDRKQRDKCTTCSKSRKAMTEQEWECSAVVCPCRRVCWAGGTASTRNPVAKVPNPYADYFDQRGA